MNNFILSQLPNILLSFLITYICIPPIIRVSKAKKLFDEPNHRKLNKSVVPTLGGVGIFIGLIISFVVFHRGILPAEMFYLFGATIMLFFIGIKDDILVISARKKFMVQVAAVSLLVLCGDFKIESFDNLFNVQNFPDWFEKTISFIVILFIINAMNLIDGIDGLASGIALFVSSVLGVWFYQNGLYSYCILSFSLAGSLLAFLRFNLFSKENKIFMGDTGSLIIGVTLSVLAIKFANSGTVAETYVGHFKHYSTIALALLIVPVCDVLRVFSIRLYYKRSPFSPDMNHIHHLLIKLGFTHIKASCFLIGYTILFFSLSLFLQNYTSEIVSFLSILTLSFIFIAVLNQTLRVRNTRKETHMILIRKILTNGISAEEEKIIGSLNKRKYFFKRRA